MEHQVFYGQLDLHRPLNCFNPSNKLFLRILQLFMVPPEINRSKLRPLAHSSVFNRAIGELWFHMIR